MKKQLNMPDNFSGGTPMTSNTALVDPAFLQQAEQISGVYSPHGKRLQPSQVLMTPENIKKREAILRSMMSVGTYIGTGPLDEAVATSSEPRTSRRKVKAKGKKEEHFPTLPISPLVENPSAFVSPPQPTQPSTSLEELKQSLELQEQEHDRLIAKRAAQAARKSVWLSNDFGKTRLKPQTVLENDHGFLLVFEDDESLDFEPIVGATYKLSVEKDLHPVYYPGITFTWTDEEKKLMLFIKNERDADENSE
jgi:hypothetical protein